jgi:hypothetical protein
VDLTDPTTAALRSAEALERAELPYALYGGLLLAACGEPRETRDVDVAVVDVTVAQARRALSELQVATQLEFEGVVSGGLSVDRLALLGGEKDLGLNTIDLVRPRSLRYRKDALARALEAPLRDQTVRVLTPEDFVLFKLLSTRDLDLEDAASVYRFSGDFLEHHLVEREVEVLAGEIPDQDVRSRYARLRDWS